MQPSDIWSPDTLFVETDVRDAVVGSCLVESGLTKYLGVTADGGTVDRLRAEAQCLTEKLVATRQPRVVLHNNAEVLILSGSSSLYLWRYRRVRHARQVACPLTWRPTALVGMIGWLLLWLVGRYRGLKVVTCRNRCGDTRRLLVSRVARVKLCYHTSLHFIPHELGLRGLFEQFDQHDVPYVVLRWFEELPEVEPTGDVDLLISDEALDRVLALLNSGPGVRQCDLYTPSGLPRTDYRKASYYPPHLAQRLLVGARRHRDFCLVPDPRDYFHSLAYHAVYHKGPRSGLAGAERFARRRRKAARDYTRILRTMADELGIDAPISLEGLHDYLGRVGWGPPPDLILRMSAGDPRNRWLAWLAQGVEVADCDPGLNVFVVRQEAIDKGYQQRVLSMIRQAGYEILAAKMLSPEEVEYGALRSRGGNWGPGPRDHTGGPPAMVVVVFDAQPIPPTRKQKKRHPRVINGRQFVKEEIREAINAELPPGGKLNGLHSGDYPAEARHLLEVFAPELIEPIARQIEARRRGGEPPGTAEQLARAA